MTEDKTVSSYEVTTEVFRDRLEHWLKAYDFETDTTIYSREEWIAREEVEVSADDFQLHMTSEGPLCHLINYGFETDQDTEILDKFANHHGWFVEQGYHWSWHFMPLSQFDTECERPPSRD